MLLDAGANMTARDGVLKSTPLGWACRWGRAELVKLLLERGCGPGRSGRRTLGNSESVGGENGPYRGAELAAGTLFCYRLNLDPAATI